MVVCGCEDIWNPLVCGCEVTCILVTGIPVCICELADAYIDCPAGCIDALVVRAPEEPPKPNMPEKIPDPVVCGCEVTCILVTGIPVCIWELADAYIDCPVMCTGALVIDAAVVPPKPNMPDKIRDAEDIDGCTGREVMELDAASGTWTCTGRQIQIQG